MDSVQRFSTRVDNYAKYRPGYPAGVIGILRSACGLSETSIIADVGSGTGILTELFLKNGNRVFAVEPNAPMRYRPNGSGRLSEVCECRWQCGRNNSGRQQRRLITAAQAFHWFDRAGPGGSLRGS